MTDLERREHQRYLAPRLSILLKSIRSKAGLEEPVELVAVDFSHVGMAVQCKQNLKIGDELRIAISDGLNKAVDVVCFVCNRAKIPDGYRCGLHFQDPQEVDRSTKQSLLALEQQLEVVL